MDWFQEFIEYGRGEDFEDSSWNCKNKEEDINLAYNLKDDLDWINKWRGKMEKAVESKDCDFKERE